MSGPGSYYGLSADPFDKHFSTPANCFPSDDHRQAVSRLEHLKEIRGIGLITAGPGMGKSVAAKQFSAGLNPNLYREVYVCLSTATIGEFYRHLCDELGIAGVYGRASQVKAIKDLIHSMYADRRQTLVLTVDEAQYLSTAILQDLKILMNFDHDTLNCFALVLLGEPYLKSVISRPVHAALKQRVMVHYEYAGLSDSEVPEYVLHKIRAAGGSPGIIEPSALSAVHGSCGGNPRLIDRLMSDALIIGEQQEKKTIDADVILAAAENRL